MRVSTWSAFTFAASIAYVLAVGFTVLTERYSVALVLIVIGGIYGTIERFIILDRRRARRRARRRQEEAAQRPRG